MKINIILRRRLSALKDMRMEHKLLLVFLLLVTLPLTFISYFSYTNYSRSIQEKTIVYSTNMLDSMIARVDDYIDDMIRISSIPAYQDDIKQNLMRSNKYHEQRAELTGSSNVSTAPMDFDLQLSIQRGIERNMSFINNIKRGANSVYIFDQYGNGYYSAQGGIRQDIQESYQVWKEKVDASSGEALLFSTQKYKNNLNSTKYAFTVVRKIMDKSLQPIGMIAVDANISVIEDQILDLDNITGGNAIIIDEAGNVIYDQDLDMLAVNISDMPMVKKAVGRNGSFYENVDGKSHLFTYITSPNTKWKVILSIPVERLTRDTVVIRNVTLVATFVTVALALIISIIFSFALTKPLRKMIRLMKSVQEGDFSVQFPVRHRDEVGLLGNQFNRMIGRIDQLIHDIYRSETRRREAELHAQQSQINPHFMYNTLESIRMAAELNDDTDVADMTYQLGILLRYSISNVNEQVTLERELKHVRQYVRILNYRYPNRFQLSMEIPPELHHYPVVKLLLQPIVENAIYHGMDDEKPVMHIAISCEYVGNGIMISIKDDGIGIDKIKLQQLHETLAGIREPAPGKGGVGLKNVNERIKLHYGETYGLMVTSIFGTGTTVEICLPLPAADSGGLPVLNGGSYGKEGFE
ncbi:cache domain-containing sensor histidine kinase [Gorillibacterium massiliense]|uniref:cache domain-containing sensor histidine kinase n=1 Tax=Gorillibacterium massiliense TaxID=1280390 RepID=UPI0004B24867|nr:sensor histidine kinase [Gorillibacterium massiliense]